MKTCVFLCLVVCATAVQAQERPTLFITPTTDNFEVYLSAAMVKKLVPVSVVTKEEGAVLVLKASAVDVQKQSTGSKVARCLFAYCAGIEDAGSTTVQIVKGDRVEWSYSSTRGAVRRTGRRSPKRSRSTSRTITFTFSNRGQK